MTGIRRSTVPLLVAVLSLAGALAAPAADVAGSQDHPLLSRVPGSEIVAWDQKEFDSCTLIVGEGTTKDGFEATRTVEGRVTRIGYRLPGDRSTLEASRSYQRAVEAAGFRTVLAWEGFDDFGFFVRYLKLPGEARLYPGEVADNSRKGDARYFLGRLDAPSGPVWVSVYAYREIGKSAPALRLRVVEEKGMEGGLVVADAEALRGELESVGSAAVYGLLFETDSAVLDPASEPALVQLTRLMVDNPSMSVWIVGHTDSTGSFEHNLDLSRRRAEALVDALVARGVARARLGGYGVGPLAPAASNGTEAGRALNRRVELVLKER